MLRLARIDNKQTYREKRLLSIMFAGKAHEKWKLYCHRDFVRVFTTETNITIAP
jgi:hypothetical protein